MMTFFVIEYIWFGEEKKWIIQMCLMTADLCNIDTVSEINLMK